MTTIEMKRVERADLAILENLLQFYLYDFSIYFCDDPEEQIGQDGRFPTWFDIARYVEEENFWAYLARIQGRLAGFALISDRMRLRDAPGRFVDEFFVLRCERRKGIGTALAHQVFNTYRGYWEITEVMGNTPAQAFWREAVRRYTRGRFRDFIQEEDGVEYAWQTFDSSQW